MVSEAEDPEWLVGSLDGARGRLVRPAPATIANASRISDLGATTRTEPVEPRESPSSRSRAVSTDFDRAAAASVIGARDPGAPARASPARKRSAASRIRRMGYLLKRGARFKSWRRRWFVLQGGVIYYFSSEHAFDSDERALGLIPVAVYAHIEVCAVPDGFGFALVLPGARTYYLAAATRDERTLWIDDLLALGLTVLDHGVGFSRRPTLLSGASAGSGSAAAPEPQHMMSHGVLARTRFAYDGTGVFVSPTELQAARTSDAPHDSASFISGPDTMPCALSFSVGRLITNVEISTDSRYGYGRLDDEVGFFPLAAVTIISSPIEAQDGPAARDERRTSSSAGPAPGAAGDDAEDEPVLEANGERPEIDVCKSYLDEGWVSAEVFRMVSDQVAVALGPGAESSDPAQHESMYEAGLVAWDTAVRTLRAEANPLIDSSRACTLTPDEVAAIDGLARIGVLSKCGGRVKSWRKRFFVMQELTLYYFRSEEAWRDGAEPQGSIPVAEYEQVGLLADNEMVNGFMITRCDSRTYFLAALTPVDRDAWVHAFQIIGLKLVSPGRLHLAEASDLDSDGEAAAPAPSPARSRGSSIWRSDASYKRKNTGRRRSVSLQNRVGWLYKRGGMRKNWKRRYFVLQEGELAYYEAKVLVRPLKVINLREYYEVDFAESESKRARFGFKITGDGLRTFVFAAATEEIRAQWVMAFHQVGLVRAYSVVNSPNPLYAVRARSVSLHEPARKLSDVAEVAAPSAAAAISGVRPGRSATTSSRPSSLASGGSGDLSHADHVHADDGDDASEVSSSSSTDEPDDDLDAGEPDDSDSSSGQ
ncbi:uncharacterized protein AMSG_02787 [Thecamonas trahens ATCC 50062]|uniref:PH domain-containing protein n=1 Tax=Thecamonas trahens ATCC 50062 TaxID=461836 RepID=A0A0L0D2F6_THETB|nr:hypothetical protein AMSG_02787 [Thecamonas trahens ATCC 50062]KNC46335.1 hypothetical protein AMSG_02787 [Thecamonas trahens ATCC 50062]|eukprot:XP_013760628.1 hypothetical protein AMSG_02787 [Thecamonas trahens ATCC 50062]